MGKRIFVQVWLQKTTISIHVALSEIKIIIIAEIDTKPIASTNTTVPFKIFDKAKTQLQKFYTEQFINNI